MWMSCTFPGSSFRRAVWWWSLTIFSPISKRFMLILYFDPQDQVIDRISDHFQQLEFLVWKKIQYLFTEIYNKNNHSFVLGCSPPPSLNISLLYFSTKIPSNNWFPHFKKKYCNTHWVWNSSGLKSYILKCGGACFLPDYYRD